MQTAVIMRGENPSKGSAYTSGVPPICRKLPPIAGDSERHKRAESSRIRT